MTSEKRAQKFHTVPCVPWRFCRAGRTSGEAARKIKLLQPQTPRGFSALALLYYLARPTITAMLRRLSILMTRHYPDLGSAFTVFKLYATTSNNMQQGVQTDATCNIQQCWELLANNVESVCTRLKDERNKA